MNISKKIVYLLLLPLLFLSCKDNKTEEDIKIPEEPKVEEIVPVLKSFVIEQKLNKELSKDIVGEVKDDKISLTFDEDTDRSKLIPSFTTSDDTKVLIAEVEQVSGETAVDFGKELRYTLISKTDTKREYIVFVSILHKEKPKPLGIPKLYITTKDNQPIKSKKDYLKASFKIEQSDAKIIYEGKGKIRGRGNSTWGMPKKPYKIKLDKKAKLFGMKSEKKWVLLANHLDPTLMLTATAMKIGQQLEVAYTNHIQPIDIYINGKYNGQYNLTEQVEVKKNRVDVEDGVLLELDTYFDEDYKFKTTYYRLPIMFKYPKKVSKELLQQTEQEFNELERLMNNYDFPNNKYAEYFDQEAFAKYIIVSYLTDNEEINHPKSTYIHKKKDSKKFVMGPIWDFDWAYSYEGSHRKHFSSYNNDLFWEQNKGKAGTFFFQRLLSDPKVANLVKKEWKNYRTKHFDKLLSYLDEYYARHKESRAKDYELWHTGQGNFDAEYQELRTWLVNRAGFLDTKLEQL